MENNEERDDVIRSYRKPLDSERRWAARRKFMEANWKHFNDDSKDRLASLSECFYNVEYTGCVYPPTIMDELKIFSVGVPVEVRLTAATKKKAANIKRIRFVKATEDFGMTNDECEDLEGVSRQNARVHGDMVDGPRKSPNGPSAAATSPKKVLSQKQALKKEKRKQRREEERLQADKVNGGEQEKKPGAVQNGGCHGSTQLEAQLSKIKILKRETSPKGGLNQAAVSTAPKTSVGGSVPQGKPTKEPGQQVKNSKKLGSTSKPVKAKPQDGSSLNLEKLDLNAALDDATGEKFDELPEEPEKRPVNDIVRQFNDSVKGEIIWNIKILQRIVKSREHQRSFAQIGGFEKQPLDCMLLALKLADMKYVKQSKATGAFLKWLTGTDDSGMKVKLLYNNVVLTEGFGSDLNAAKNDASQRLYKLLSNPSFLSILVDGQFHRLLNMGTSKSTRNENFDSKKGIDAKSQSVKKSNKQKEFFLVRPEDSVDSSQIISLTATANDTEYTFVESQDQDGESKKHCVQIAGKTFTGSGATRAAAKRRCLEEAVNGLAKEYPTLLVRKSNEDAQIIEKDAIIGKGAQEVLRCEKEIDNTNVGFRILQSMGWTGGSLGLSGVGIIEPITPSNNLNSRGLGYIQNDKDKFASFKTQIMETLRTFQTRAKCFDELRFSSNFTNVERAEIHKMVRTLGLKSKSRDCPEGRVLAVTHNMDWRSIYELLIDGQASSKFERLPPASWSI